MIPGDEWKSHSSETWRCQMHSEEGTQFALPSRKTGKNVIKTFRIRKDTP